MSDDKPMEPVAPDRLERRLLVISFLLGAILIGLLWAGSGSARTVNNVTVTYMYETSASRASGSTVEVESIEFHSNYVVLNHAEGSDQVLAVNRLREFTFQPTE